MVQEAIATSQENLLEDNHHLAERDTLMGHEEQGLAAHSSRTRIAKSEDQTRLKAWRKYLSDNGLPPWISQVDYDQGRIDRQSLRDQVFTPPLRSNMTVRAWADDYCASDKILKDFTFEKVHLISIGYPDSAYFN